MTTGMFESNTGNMFQCPKCGMWITNSQTHTCGVVSSFLQTEHVLVDPEVKDYLRRIAEALEQITSVRVSQDPHDRYRHLTALRQMIDSRIVDALIEIENEDEANAPR